MLRISRRIGVTKNISYMVPDVPGIKGFYRIYVRFYVDGKFNAGLIKE
ncbi:hypothetical protein [Methanocella conradii]|nr:hypothetical protein [Methanocella conradii]MDI6897064.1 hypothetical protein [Methanocella conradii]